MVKKMKTVKTLSEVFDQSGDFFTTFILFTVFK